jgi:hypothetical protein
MNSSGRIFGGLLIAVATAWILNIAGVLPFNNRTNNQLATADRTPVSDANAQRTNAQPNQTSSRTAPLNAQQTSTTSAQADNANQTDTSGASVPFDSSNPNSTGSSGATTSQTTPAVSAGW